MRSKNIYNNKREDCAKCRPKWLFLLSFSLAHSVFEKSPKCDTDITQMATCSVFDAHTLGLCHGYCLSLRFTRLQFSGHRFSTNKVIDLHRLECTSCRSLLLYENERIAMPRIPISAEPHFLVLLDKLFCYTF